MARLKKRDIKKALKELMFEAAPLSTNKGRPIRTDHCPNKVNSKKRRHSGWVTARWAGKGRYEEAMLDGLDANYYYDSWEDGRDGLRYDGDKSHIRSEFMSGWSHCRHCSSSCILYKTCSDKYHPNPIKENNEKLKRLIQIRLAKKKKQRDRLLV
jgi:hypothetical protein